MKQSISARVEALRARMEAHQIQAVIIPSNDPHQSEYVAGHWAAREWISGFTGSAGTAVVTTDQAGVWTDSRYFLQAEEQLAGTPFGMRKTGGGHPDHFQWLLASLPSGSRIAMDGRLISARQCASLSAKLEARGMSLVTDLDLVGDIWEDRPALPADAIYLHPKAMAGESRQDKLARIRKQMSGAGASHHLMIPLDDIAWAFNLRGADVDFNPVFYAYGLLSQDSAQLFVREDKVPAEVAAALQADGISLQPYDAIEAQLAALPAGYALHLDLGTASQAIRSAVPETTRIVDQPGPATAIKATKNATEVAKVRDVMVRDGVALLRLYRWLEQELPGGQVTEALVADRLAAFRAEQNHYVGESFPAIAGYAGNGAIVHYRPEHGTSATLKPEGVFLLDSGGQYLDGTTDITRTIPLGTVPEKAKLAYTMVLKGHIELAAARFPLGTAGYQLDPLARMHLWRHNLNYGHGTGHGIGFFLNVHEGPHGIRPHFGGAGQVPIPLGSITSNEPGYYEAGAFGIRIENLVLAVEAPGSGGEYLAFETLTMFPIDLEMVDHSQLTRSEVDWLNAYHRQVWEALSPALTADEKAWLETKCAPI